MLEDKPNQDALRSDEEILALARKSPDYFRVIIDRYEAAFLRKAKAILGPREEATDAVVETFTKIYLKSGQFKVQPGATFRSWAYKILTNTALTYYQKLKRERSRVVTGVDPDHWAAAPLGGAAGANDWRDQFAAALTRLPVSFGRILRLVFLESKSHQEIAELENLSLAAVKTRVHRAKKAFREIASLKEYV